MPEKRKRVLVVDDEADAREFVKTALEDLEVDVLEAADGEAGLAAARRERPDLAILDVQMPKKDGYALFSALRKDQTTAAIPVIMLTAVTKRTGVAIDAKDMGEYLGSAPEAYVDKPIDPARLREVATRLLGR